MSLNIDRELTKYAEVIVKVGLNLQPGQRLLIGAPAYFYFLDGMPIQLAPLVRRVTEVAYKEGARFVDVIWTDEETRLARFQHAARDTLDEYPTWRVKAAEEYARNGDAVLMAYAHDAGMFADVDPEIIDLAARTAARNLQPLMEHIGRGSMNWSMFSAPVPGWAASIFPEVEPAEQQARLWQAIFKMCRVDASDPVSAWSDHTDDLVARSEYLNAKRYSALKYAGPGTSLTVGLPEGHRWLSGRLTAQNGISFTANLPTEEVFTMPHAERVDGVVSGTRPLSMSGSLIEDFALRFEEGRVTGFTASQTARRCRSQACFITTF
jgi:aminopeptidase